jgi:hypothetical protein
LVIFFLKVNFKKKNETMGNYTCYLCEGETKVKKGIFGITESKIEWCESCENEISNFVDSLNKISKNTFPFNQSGTVFNNKQSDRNLLIRCGFEIKKRLSSGEEILDFIRINNGSLSSTGGMMVLTNKKFIFFTIKTSGVGGTKSIGCNSQFTTDIKNIINISSERTLSGDKIKIDCKGDPDLNKIYTDKINELESFKSKLFKIQGDTQTPTVITSGESNLDKIKKLKELLDLGVISQSEFDEKKNKLLEGI